MQVFRLKYQTPKEFDNILLESDGEYLTGLWFENSKDECKHKCKFIYQNLPVFDETIKWLDIYFSGAIPNFTPKYKVKNITAFRQEVNEIMLTIPFGKSMTYQDIGKIVAEKRNSKTMSAQAVGGAVGANPICLIIPCHRVIGKNGSLTGYGGGLKNKEALLKLEGISYK